MLRTGLGALDALLAGGASQQGLSSGIWRANRVMVPSARSIPRNQVLSRTISTVKGATASPLPVSPAARLWARGNSRTVLRDSRIQTKFRTAQRRPFQTSRLRRSGKEEPSAKSSSDAGSLSLSQRLKKLSKEYGWTAVGVYLALSVLDFPFCFLLVRVVGTEKIAAVEEVVVTNVQKFIPESVKTFWHKYRNTLKENTAKQQVATAAGGEGEAVVAEDVDQAGWGVKEAQERKQREGASLATQLALAYAIHKSFIFVRVPLTAAVLPKVVRVLRSWGWKVGTRPKSLKP